MHFIYVLARFLPYWAIPVAFVVGELGLYFRRKGSSMQFPCWAISVSLTLSVILWIIFRGDLHSDRWVRAVLG